MKRFATVIWDASPLPTLGRPMFDPCKYVVKIFGTFIFQLLNSFIKFYSASLPEDPAVINTRFLLNTRFSTNSLIQNAYLFCVVHFFHIQIFLEQIRQTQLLLFEMTHLDFMVHLLIQKRRPFSLFTVGQTMPIINGWQHRSPRFLLMWE